jgi:hypothetical protein
MKHIALLLLTTALLTACQTHQHVVLVSAEEDAIPSPAQAVSESTRSAATALLDALDKDQQKLAQHDIKAPLKQDWHFIPRQRQGLMLGDMTNEQKQKVHNLMQTALSDSGYLKATDIIWLETLLYEMSNKNPMRDPGKYALQIFGDPSDKQAVWGWRLEGHHLSINLTYTAEGIGVTPLFFGTNPAVVQEGPLSGKRVLADAHNLAIDLAKSMDDQQRKKMMLNQKPRDVITGPGREKVLTERVGVSSSELNREQQIMLLRLAGAHWDTYEHQHRSELVNRVLAGSDWPQLFRFAWAGPIDANGVFYYRISSLSKKFVIEYSCQSENHVHCVIHDLTDPLQEDLLKKHFEQHEH